MLMSDLQNCKEVLEVRELFRTLILGKVAVQWKQMQW